MNRKTTYWTGLILVSWMIFSSCTQQVPVRKSENFNADWRFSLSGDSTVIDPVFDDHAWRELDLPHDWSIEGSFAENNPAGTGGGALPGGIGWYRKTFSVPEESSGKNIFIEFDGVYRNSDVWLNGKHLGYRPNGYISFRYDLTPYLKQSGNKNVLVVRVDNSKQPNSRWYSGSGIFRNVRMVTVAPIHVDHWGTFITTPKVDSQSATILLNVKIRNTGEQTNEVEIKTSILDPTGNIVIDKQMTQNIVGPESLTEFNQQFSVSSPELWSTATPHLYKAITEVYVEDKIMDRYETTFGIRYFNFDINKGFTLNGNPMKILGVCLHHDLGALGSAVNTHAIERQLKIMQNMGVNAIRTSHNPPAPELLDLCDRMGLLVMDEMFDMWKISKTEFDYSHDWDEWYEKDLTDFILRDRNHPSIVVWSIGNEIMEQYNRTDSTGIERTKAVAAVVRKLDTTRPITAANNDVHPHNRLIMSGALDLIGYNYHHDQFEDFLKDHPGQKFIATETTSALATRGYYQMPSDSIMRWPIRWDIPFNKGNPDHTVSAYDHVSTPWGSTHEETWKIVKKHDFLSGMFIWTGFDYLGEPTPYGWPSRSSYFGIVDLAGFPKDSYYMYQSEWTTEPVLHIFPHWNWEEGKTVDIWAYYNNADEVELFLNDESLGIKKKAGDELHVQWRVPFKAGTLKAVTRKNGNEVLTKKISTAGKATRIELETGRDILAADGSDLAFVTVKIVDAEGNIVPDAENTISMNISGPGFIAGHDNGDPTSHESFRGNTRKVFHGLALVIVQTEKMAGKIYLEVASPGLEKAVTSMEVE